MGRYRSPGEPEFTEENEVASTVDVKV